jgi:hypothetical protein
MLHTFVRGTCYSSLTLALGVCVAGHPFDKPPEIGKLVFLEGGYYQLITESDATARNTISAALPSPLSS